MRLDAETAHDHTLRMLKFISRSNTLHSLESRILANRVPSLPIEVFGRKFKNPVGLAAGFDKNAIALNSLAEIGFGFVELGTVTPEPQPGNQKKRLFRVEEDEAIVNRLGFNSAGLNEFLHNLRSGELNRNSTVVGINIGKNSATPNNQAITDYLRCLEGVHEYADYIAVNVSSPNSPHLRDLQSADHLDQLLEAIMQRRDELAKEANAAVTPIALKISPDLEDADIASVAQVAQQHNVSAIIATNTTTTRPTTSVNQIYGESGGLSGRPLNDLSTSVIKKLSETLDHSIPIIGVGGVFDSDDAWRKLMAGASLVQIYSSLIYRGPSVVRNIVLGLSEQASRFDSNDFSTALRLARENNQGND